MISDSSSRPGFWEAGFVWSQFSPAAEMTNVGPWRRLCPPGSICCARVYPQACTCPCAPHSSQLPLPGGSLTPISQAGAKAPERLGSPGHTAFREGGSRASGGWGSLCFLGLRGAAAGPPPDWSPLWHRPHVGTHSTSPRTQCFWHSHTCSHTQLGLEAAVSWGSLCQFPDALRFYEHLLRVWRKGNSPTFLWE